MNKPSPMLYNYKALVISIPSPDSITALVDHGFRSWSMRQFRLAGVSLPDPRSLPKGGLRDSARSKSAELRKVLEMILNPDGSSKGKNILISPEKPAFSGHFSANVFVAVGGSPDPCYCIKHAGIHWFDVCTFMKELCSGSLAVDVGISFIKSIDPKSFIR